MAQSVGERAPGLALRTTRGRVVLIAAVSASAMASLDATVVNVALPHLGREFHADVSSLQWVLTGYLLALSSLILLGGALGDRFGRRRIFVIGTVWFAVASLLCAASQNIGTLVAARVAEGVGGALLTPGSLAILQASFRESDSAAAVGAWSGLGGIAGAIGPFVGGGLVDGPGWRWAFLINVPVAAVAIVCAMSSVPETRDMRWSGHLDVRGAAIAVAALAPLTWALTEAGSQGWSSAAVVVPGVAGVVAAALFVRHLRRVHNPLVPPALFRDRAFTVVNLATVQLYGAIGVAFFLVAYELQVGSGWTALRAGIAMLPATVLMLILSARSGALAQRIGPRIQLSLGPPLAGAGLILLARIGTHPSWLTDVLPGAFVFGIGLVVFVAPLTATVMAAADADHVSVASGVNNAIARTASLAALAVIPVVSGLARATGAAQVTHSYRVAMVIAGVLAALAGVTGFVGLRSSVRGIRGARRLYCAVDGPPIQADPARCPVRARPEFFQPPEPPVSGTRNSSSG